MAKGDIKKIKSTKTGEVKTIRSEGPGSIKVIKPTNKPVNPRRLA